MAKIKALISFAVTANLICVFVFAYADCWFSHEVALLLKDYEMKLDSYCQNRMQSEVCTTYAHTMNAVRLELLILKRLYYTIRPRKINVVYFFVSFKNNTLTYCISI